MHQASALIDLILKSKFNSIPKTIKIEFSENEISNWDAVLEYSHPDYGGSMYTVRDTVELNEEFLPQIWLCPVLTYFFSTPPLKLWANILPELEC